jgi:phosphomannomutase
MTLELPVVEGGIQSGDRIYVAYDLRPSSTAFVEEHHGRGELVQAVIAAVEDAGLGLSAVNLGSIPTPALTAYALNNRCASVMVTGSHIPFDRNGYKFNTAVGELLKEHELLIAKHTNNRRHELYSQLASESPFDEYGMFRDGHHPLPIEDGAAVEAIFCSIHESLSSST